MKTPRCNLKKTYRISNTLRSNMLGMGEGISNGRPFEEVMEKGYYVASLGLKSCVLRIKLMK